MRKQFVVLAFALSLLPSQALAQEEGKVGVTMGYPAAIGVLWHTTDRVAIRPELSFSFSSSESDIGESDGTNLATGISVLFYTSKSDNLATYVAPRYAFQRLKSDRTFEGEQFIESDIESTTRGHVFAGNVGAQYFMGSRFSVFGEVGLSYARSKSTSDPNDSESKTWSFGLGSNIGIVLYF